jgi:outer membrane lipoprotein-sorting protein
MPIRKFAFAMKTLIVAAGLALVAGAPALALSDDEAKTLEDVNAYFNSVKTMNGDFVQFGPEGSQSDGKFYIARPGKVRFYYNPPAKLDIIADGKSVSVRDRKMATQDIWPLSQTPLRFLLSDDIDLQKDTNITNVLVEDDLVTVTLTDQTTFNSGVLTLIFDAKTYELKQWTVRDAQGYETSVAVYNVVANGPTNPDLFKIDYLANARQGRD